MIRRSLQRFQLSVTSEAFHKNAKARPEAQPKMQALYASMDSNLAETSIGDLALRYYEELLTPTIAKPLTLPRIAELMLARFHTKSPFTALYHFLATNALGGNIDVAMELVRMCGLSNSAAEGDGEMVFKNLMKPGAYIFLNEMQAPLDYSIRVNEDEDCTDYNFRFKGPTPIAIALAAGRLDVVERILVDKEFEPEILSKVFAVNSAGCNVIILCVKYGMHEAVSLIASQETLKSHFSAFLHCAIKEDKPKILETLLALPVFRCKVNSDNNFSALLHYAVKEDKAKILETLLALPDIRSGVNSDKNFSAFLHCAVKADKPKILETLLALPDFRARVNSGVDGNLLHEAIMRRHLEVVDVLLKSGADANTRVAGYNRGRGAGRGRGWGAGFGGGWGAGFGGGRGAEGGERGQTALEVAFNCNSDKNFVTLLLAHGADANGTGNGASPLLWAIDRGWPDVMATMIGLGAKVNVPLTSISPLLHAVKNRKIKEASLLLESGADFNAYGKVEDTEESRRQEKIYTPLQLAVECDNLQLVELLLASGADPLKCSIIKECPLFYYKVGTYRRYLKGVDKIFQLLAKHTMQSADEAFLKVLAKEVGFRGSTILQLAAGANDVDTIIAFAKAGADPLLGLSNACHHRNYAACVALVKCGVDVRKELEKVLWDLHVVPLLGDEEVK